MRNLVTSVAAAAVALAGSAAFAEDVVVKWLHQQGSEEVREYWDKLAADYSARTDGVTIEVQHIESQSFKAKLTTLLQSNDAPHFFYSWGGGVMQAQVDSGTLRDVTAEMGDGWADTFGEAAVGAFTYKDKIWGAPYLANLVGFWYNKQMFADAGVVAEDIKTWDDLLVAVEKLKATGVVPIGLGGMQKWPTHFYYTHLMLRIGGQQGFVDAVNEVGDGFAGETYIRAGQEFKRLVDLDPFQPGFVAADQNNMYGALGDGDHAMQLMGSWLYGRQKSKSKDGIGLTDDELGWFPFPMVEGGAGTAEETLGGINGWLFHKSAPPEAVDFVKYFLSKEVQEDMAKRGWIIPVARGADAAIADPFQSEHSARIANSPYHQIFYDQMLGPDVGLVVNDMAAELAVGNVSPEDAAAEIQDAWLDR